jgi:hypothetical protein
MHCRRRNLRRLKVSATWSGSCHSPIRYVSIHASKYGLQRHSGAVRGTRVSHQATLFVHSHVASLREIQGTSYTISNTQHITNTSAASNYGQDLPTESLVRVRPDSEDSPFLLKPERHVPDLVLTKTHCTGFCDDCKTFFVARDDFRAGCGESHVAPHDKNYYNATALVKKAVHLFRNPFDNLVSRKHLGVQIRQRDMGRWNGDEDVIATDTPEGLLAWCQFVDSSVVNRAVGWSATSAEFRSLFRSIPCAAEIYRYVQWHNRAIEATQALQLPVHYMYYEDYSNAYNETVLGLLNFLELNMTREGFDAALQFDAGQKSYDGLFQHRNFSKTAMTAFLRRLASNDTWHHVRRYVDSWYDESKQQEGESKVHI